MPRAADCRARSFLIDTDTASDDAVALLMALRAPDVEVVAVTTVAGNVDVQTATRNALYTVERCSATTPVFEGAAAPLGRPLQDGRWFHGRDGMGDQDYPPPRSSKQAGDAVDAIVDCVDRHPGLTLVTLGPLTNVALALQRAPRIVAGVARCVVMGGNPQGVGNVTPAAEFNFWVDPEAAHAVIASGLPIDLVGWELCRGDAVLHPNDIERLLASGSDLARFAIDCNREARQAYRRQTGEDGISLPDPVAMAIALDRSIATSWSRHRVAVESHSELTRGATIVDRLGVAANEINRAAWKALLAREPSVDVCWALDVGRWKRLLELALA
jgi:purine nucleosidase